MAFLFTKNGGTMKAIKWNAIMINCLVTVIAIAGFSFTTNANNPATIKTSAAFKQEKAVINKDLNNIKMHQDKIVSLKKQHHDERAAGVKNTSTCSDLMKAKADLRKDKEYLKADKVGLMMSYQALLIERKEAIKDEKTFLKSSRQKLDADLAKGNASAVLYTQEVVNSQRSIKQQETALKQMKIERNNDLLAINKQIKDVDGQSSFMLASENSWAKTQNLAMK